MYLHRMTFLVELPASKKHRSHSARSINDDDVEAEKKGVTTNLKHHQAKLQKNSCSDELLI